MRTKWPKSFPGKIKAVTFKKTPTPTGLSRVGHVLSTEIKISKKECGIIYGPKLSQNKLHWTIAIAVKKTQPDDNPNCDWHWITLDPKFDLEEQARTWIKQAMQGLALKHTLHFFNK